MHQFNFYELCLNADLSGMTVLSGCPLLLMPAQERQSQS